MKKFTKILLIIAGAVLVLVAGLFFAVTNGLSEGLKLPIDGVDLSAIPDGSYTGTYEYKRWTNTAVVHIKGHRIVAIELERDPTGITDDIIRRVIEKQDTKVDAIAGATVSSKAYLKAIENALGEQEGLLWNEQ